MKSTTTLFCSWNLWLIHTYITQCFNIEVPSWIYSELKVRIVMQSVFVFVVSILFLFIVPQINPQMYMCQTTEVYFISPEEESNPISFECYCNDFSTSCLWSSFSDRGNILSSGTSESLFMWNRSVGYGQYICVKDEFIVAVDVLILPQSKEIITMKCAQCMSFRAWLSFT